MYILYCIIYQLYYIYFYFISSFVDDVINSIQTINYTRRLNLIHREEVSDVAIRTSSPARVKGCGGHSHQGVLANIES